MSLTTLFSRLETTTLSERIALQIEEAIMNGSIRSGEKINTDALARQFNISHIPVREALKQLEAIGLVTQEANKSARVLKLSKEDVKNIFEVRKVLEGLAISLAVPRLDSKSVSRFQTLVRRMHEATRLKEFANLFAADKEFHQTIWEMSGNPFLIKSLSNLLRPYFGFLATTGYYHYLRLDKLNYVPQMHQKVFDAMMSGNGRLAKQVLVGAHNRSMTFMLEDRPDDLMSRGARKRGRQTTHDSG